MSEIDNTLSTLHTAVAQKLLEKVMSGEATAAELNVARQFLKDNGIDSTPQASRPLHDLAINLPFPTSRSIPSLVTQ